MYAIHPNNPYGLDMEWFKLLALYSNIGKKSNSDDKFSELGEELKRLHGNHDMVIKGINDKIQSLIERRGGGPIVSEENLRDLKEKIVAELGKVASNRDSSAASEPVVCNHDGVIWTDDALDTLKTTVQSVMANGFSKQGQLLDDIKTNQVGFLETVGGWNRSISNLPDKSNFDMLEDRLKQHGRGLNGISSKIDGWKNPDGDDAETGPNVVPPETIQEDWSNILQTQAETLKALVAEQSELKQTLKDGLADIHEKLFEVKEGGVGEDRQELPREYNLEVYDSSIERVIDMFSEKNVALMIVAHPPNPIAKRISAYRKEQGVKATEISPEKMREIVRARITHYSTNDISTTTDLLETLLKDDAFLPVEILRIMHVALYHFDSDSRRHESKTPERKSFFGRWF